MIVKNINGTVKFGNKQLPWNDRVEVNTMLVECKICGDYHDGFVDDDGQVMVDCDCDIEDYLHVDDCYSVEEHNNEVVDLENQKEELEEKLHLLEAENQALKDRIEDLEENAE